MRKTLFTLILFLSVLCANAEKPDTTIYQSCRLADSPDTKGIDDEHIKIIFDSCPQFKNGFDDLVNYIASHVHYPLNARKNHVEGKVIISTVIEKDGRISHAEVVHSVSRDLDEEALRVINSLPKWKPGVLHRKPVRIRYYMLVSFKIPSDNNKSLH